MTTAILHDRELRDLIDQLDGACDAVSSIWFEEPERRELLSIADDAVAALDAAAEYLRSLREAHHADHS
jgi:hypothetical protein